MVGGEWFGGGERTASNSVAGSLPLRRSWLLATLVGPWCARDLQSLRFLGFPLSFWMASQGALIVYILIIVSYALAMDRLDAGYRADDAESP